MRALPAGLIALAGATALAPSARADVVVRVPFVQVVVGPVVEVRAPFVHIVVPRRTRVLLPPPPRPSTRPASAMLPAAPRVKPGDPPPVPKEEEVRDARIPTVLPASRGTRTTLAPARPPAAGRGSAAPVAPPPTLLTPAQFAGSLPTAGGTHQVLLEHPFTRAPVKLTLNLPPGKPRQVHVSRLRLELDYGRQVVTVRFFRNGTVQVR
jgi:hypothetical protein